MSDLFDEMFTAAKNEFAAKEDLKDRLVAIFPTGKTGTRKSEANSKDYPWIETVTVVLDDGPDGSSFTELVPAAPQVIVGFQWSAAGLVARLNPMVSKPVPMALVGRINSRKNSKKGLADAWSIAEPTPEDMAKAREHGALCAEVRQDIIDVKQAASDETAGLPF